MEPEHHVGYDLRGGKHWPTMPKQSSEDSGDGKASRTRLEKRVSEARGITVYQFSYGSRALKRSAATGLA